MSKLSGCSPSEWEITTTQICEAQNTHTEYIPHRPTYFQSSTFTLCISTNSSTIIWDLGVLCEATFYLGELCWLTVLHWFPLLSFCSWHSSDPHQNGCRWAIPPASNSHSVLKEVCCRSLLCLINPNSSTWLLNFFFWFASLTYSPPTPQVLFMNEVSFCFPICTNLYC